MADEDESGQRSALDDDEELYEEDEALDADGEDVDFHVPSEGLALDQRRLAALKIAASVRGATNEEDALLWMADRELIGWDEGLSAFTLTTAGREYGDRMIEALPTGETPFLRRVNYRALGGAVVGLGALLLLRRR